MPTVAVDKEDLWERLGHKYCESFSALVLLISLKYMLLVAPEEFDRLLFEFGLELDEDVRYTHHIHHGKLRTYSMT